MAGRAARGGPLFVINICQVYFLLRYSITMLGLRTRLRLVTSRGPPYPSRSPRAHPSGWYKEAEASYVAGSPVPLPLPPGPPVRLD